MTDDRMNVQETLTTLLAGNERFVAGAPEHPNQDAARRAEIAPAQTPFAVLFGCSDSRIAAEIIFDRELGDLFVVRTAGHVVGTEVLGSIEYGVSVLGCPLVVVLGHDACGAVAATRAAVEDGATAGGFVRDVIERVTPRGPPATPRTGTSSPSTYGTPSTCCSTAPACSPIVSPQVRLLSWAWPTVWPTAVPS